MVVAERKHAPPRLSLSLRRQNVRRFQFKCGRFISFSIIFTLLIFTSAQPQAQGQSLSVLSNTPRLVPVSDDLIGLLHNPTNARVNVIVQLNGPLSLTVRTLITAIGGQITDTFDNFDMIAVNLPQTSLLQLIALP